MKNKDYEPFDGNQLIENNGLTLDNSNDKVSIYGTLDITRDKIGLKKIQDILKYLNSIESKLLNEKEKSILPEKIEDKEIKIVKNPF